MGVARSRPGASSSAIQYHYDLGNDFYALWLDETLTYSCALWDTAEDLTTAQVKKLDWHLSNCGPGVRRLLDVGCGWGSILKRAVQNYDVQQAVGLSLSREQERWIQEHIPLPEVNVRLENWMDHRPEAPYDGIVSIGAFEHFARLDQTPAEKLAGYREFFECCHEWLHPAGTLSLQTIVYENSTRRDFSPFFAESIFPESDLPHIFEIAQAIRGLFEIKVWRNDRSHYARTLRCWLEGLRTHRQEAEAIAGTEKVKQYEKYLGLMILAFHTGTMNLARIHLRRLDRGQVRNSSATL